MKLAVPFYHQEHSTTCGLAALRMVFGYFDDQISESDLRKETKIHSFGSFSTDLGVIAINHSYKVTAYTFHLSLLGPLKLPFGTVINNTILKKIVITPSDKMIFTSWQKYLSAGGKLIWEQPKISQLKHSIDTKLPAIISVNTAALNRYWKNSNNGHYFVIEGYNTHEFNVVDPHPIKEPHYRISSDILLPAWTINSKNSSDHLMILQK